MEIAITMDSFKGSINSLQAGQAVAAGILSVSSKVQTKVYEVSDGGEGSLQAVKSGLDTFEEIQVSVVNSINEATEVSYLITQWEAKKTAIIESASVVGIEAVTPSEETTSKGSSFGLGQLLADAIKKECQRVVIFLGGTATSDGGLGLLWGIDDAATGKKGRNLLLDSDIQLDFTGLSKKFAGIEILIGSDVTNPFSGPTGFAHVFAKQKGASLQQIEELDLQATNMEKAIYQQLGISLNQISGTGAAGGLAGALTVLGGEIYSGFDLVTKLTDLERKLQTAELIYTGEGSIDSQSSQGKLPMRISQIAEKYRIPTIALCGKRTEQIGELGEKILGAFSIQQGPISLEEAVKETVTINNLTITAAATFQLFRYQ